MELETHRMEFDSHIKDEVLTNLKALAVDENVSSGNVYKENEREERDSRRRENDVIKY